MIVLVSDLEISLEQIDHRQVARGLAIGHGGCLEDQPFLDPMRVRELVDQPRLAHAGLAHNGDNLAAASTSLTEDPAQVFDLSGAAHEAREAPQGRHL